MSDETVETTDEYKEEVERLFGYLQRRKQLVDLLKIAKPDKIAALREVIADLDNLIERTEHIMALQAEKFEQERVLEKQYAELSVITDNIKEELIEYVAENNPEKLELLKDLFDDESEKTH